MLKSFKIENFNSIKEPIIFSMEAEMELSEHADYISILDDNSKLLKVASIYGPNASGKSTILSAICFLQDIIFGRLSRENPHIRDIISERKMRETSSGRYSRYFSYTPFKFTNNENNQTKISVVFARKSIEYWYQLTIEFNYGEDTLIKIIDESFSVKKEHEESYNTIFSRVNNVIYADEILESIGASKLAISNDMTILRHLIVNYVDIDVDVYAKPQQNYLTYVSNLYSEINSLRLITNLHSGTFMRYNEKTIENNKNFIIDSLQKLDISVHDIEIEELSRFYQIYCIHKIGDATYRLRIEQESQGTQILIYLLSLFADRKDKPTIFLIDELDSHLHPKLIKEIIRLFNSNINQNNQLIFNSHDIWNMVLDNFRRDQIWFTYRNNELATELLCLSDIVNYEGKRVRNDAKYSKQYMEGKYGADPFIKKGLDWHE